MEIFIQSVTTVTTIRLQEGAAQHPPTELSFTSKTIFVALKSHVKLYIFHFVQVILCNSMY